MISINKLKNMKSQASLEMVVGLIILLVVAAVVITLVLYFIKPEMLPKPRETLKVSQFYSNCEAYCRDRTSLRFCTEYYPGEDWNGNGVKSEKVSVGEYNWITCEDRIYCFLLMPCDDRFGEGREEIENCRKALCQVYIDKYGDIEIANRKLLETISFSRKCNLNDVEPEENWYNNIFVKKKCNDLLPTYTTQTTTEETIPSPPTLPS